MMAKGTKPKDLFSQETLFTSVSSPDLIASFPDLSKILFEKLQSWSYKNMPRKLPVKKMESLILLLCTQRWLTLNELSVLLERDSKAIQDQYLSRMLNEEKLYLKYADKKNHPNQAYMTNK